MSLLHERITALERLHDTLPVTPNGKRSSFIYKGKDERTAFNLKLNDTVSFPRLHNNNYDQLGAKPKKRKTTGINGGYTNSPKIKLSNRYLPLQEVTEDNKQTKKKDNVNSEITLQNTEHEVKTQQQESTTVPKVKAKVMLLGDGAISNINTSKFVTRSFPSATVSDITNLLPEELRKHPLISQLIIHVGAVDISKGESEILKKDFNTLFETLDCVDKDSIQIYISGPLPNIDRRINKFSRLLQLNTWLSKACASRGLHFIENFNLFWQRNELFRRKGSHLNRRGLLRLTDNFLIALRNHKLPQQNIPVQSDNDPALTIMDSVKDLTTTAPPASQEMDPPQDSAQASPQDSAQASPQESAQASPEDSAQAPPQDSTQAPPQDWDPPTTSTPSGDSLHSFPSPQSPMRFPDHLESLVKSGIKVLPLTPDMARSRIRSPKKNSAPLPPRFASPPPLPPRFASPKASSARPPPPRPRADIFSSGNAADI